MPFDLLLLPLAGGYWFVSLAHRYRLSAAKQSGERLILTAATAGIALAIASWIATTGIVIAFPHFHTLWRTYVPWNYAGTALGAFLMGPAAANVFNLFVDASDAESRAINESGTGLERLFWDATSPENPRLVQVSLDDGKVYVGWIQRTSTNPRSPDGFVRVLPIRSGYRDEMRRVQFTTFYESVFSKMIEDGEINDDEAKTLQDFLKVIPLSRIVSAGIFDPTAYKLFRDGNDRSHA